MYYTIKILGKNKTTNLESLLFKEEVSTTIQDTYITKKINNTNSIKLNETTLENLEKLIDNFLKLDDNFKNNKEKYYREFKIPKRKGGYRYLIDPAPELKMTQKYMLQYFEYLHIYPHNAAYAFIKHRDAVENAKIHKDHKCLITLDLHNFFPSITEELLKKELLENAIFNKLEETKPGIIDKIVLISTYKGALPQGSPLSPFLSNIVMEKFDYTLIEMMKNKQIENYTYTRYADDMCFSSNAFGNCKKFVHDIDNLLKTCYNNSIQLNKEKTKFLKNTGRCYVTGVKLNKNNQATYGHENKRKLKLELFNLFVLYGRGEATKEQVQETLGRFSYMQRIEPDYAMYLQRKLLKQFNSQAFTLAKHFKF